MTENEFTNTCDKYVRQGDFEAALEACNQYILANPLSAIGFRKRAALRARKDHFDEAIVDIDKAIEMNPNEASYYFFRGWWELERGNFLGTEANQTSAIEKEREQEAAEGTSVSESAYFFRSIARLKLGKFKDALSDSEHVEDEFLIYLKSFGEVTKAEIVREALYRAE